MRPRQESNLHLWLRRPVLYPLSYEDRKQFRLLQFLLKNNLQYRTYMLYLHYCLRRKGGSYVFGRVFRNSHRSADSRISDLGYVAAVSSMTKTKRVGEGGAEPFSSRFYLNEKGPDAYHASSPPGPSGFRGARTLRSPPLHDPCLGERLPLARLSEAGDVSSVPLFHRGGIRDEPGRSLRFSSWLLSPLLPYRSTTL